MASLWLSPFFLRRDVDEGRGGSKRRGRGSGSGFGVPWETMKIILIVGAVIIGVFGIYICISICDAHDDEEDKR